MAKIDTVGSANKFLQQIQFFNPRKSLALPEKPDLSSCPQRANIPGIEFVRYRSLARNFSCDQLKKKQNWSN